MMIRMVEVNISSIIFLYNNKEYIQWYKNSMITIDAENQQKSSMYFITDAEFDKNEMQEEIGRENPPLNCYYQRTVSPIIIFKLNHIHSYILAYRG